MRKSQNRKKIIKVFLSFILLLNVFSLPIKAYESENNYFDLKAEDTLDGKLKINLIYSQKDFIYNKILVKEWAVADNSYYENIIIDNDNDITFTIDSINHNNTYGEYKIELDFYYNDELVYEEVLNNQYMKSANNESEQGSIENVEELNTDENTEQDVEVKIENEVEPIADLFEIEDFKIVSISDGRYTVEGTVSNGNSVSEALVPTWTEVNGQDDLYWGKGKVEGNKVTYTVDMKDHKYELGKYISQLVVRDISGKEAIATVIAEMTNKGPEIENLHVSSSTDGRYTVEGTVNSGYGISEV
ncbi:GBS Bsp-like repeat-containing protein, partial [Erysipelotrichaceae bacterium HCN-30851]